MKLITLLTTAFSVTSLITGIPAFSQPMQSAICTNSTNSKTEPRKEARIDNNCKIQYANNSLVFYWSNGTKTLIEGKLNGFGEVKINGQKKWLNYSLPRNKSDEMCLNISTSQNAKLSEIFCFITPSLKSLLKDGIYTNGNKIIIIYSKDRKFCWRASSRHGTNVQSLRSFSNFPNIYVLEEFGSFIYANGQKNTISFGGTDGYRFDSRINYISPKVQSCLNSSKHYYSEGY
jgi:hypothetical protein